jgi:hypothetical protein
VLLFALIAIVVAQPEPFAAGEAQRVYDLLDGLGCIGNVNCTYLGNFTPTSTCEGRVGNLKCDAQGLLAYL